MLVEKQDGGVEQWKAALGHNHTRNNNERKLANKQGNGSSVLKAEPSHLFNRGRDIHLEYAIATVDDR